MYKDQKKLRRGYTTGTCSAAAARAAAWMLLSGQAVEQVHITTPAGIPLALIPEEVVLEKDRVSCGIRKDGGDDADVTDGILIFAEVKRKEGAGVSITGGRGIGKVTAKGLEQEPGSYAINRVPRRMIREAVEEVMEIHGYEGGLLVTISAPEGEALAARTFNPHIGIEGGISILGTSGIVEPMSEQALVDTIALELSMQAAAGRSCCMMTPGNYGMQFLSGVLQLDPGLAVKCSNFIGDTIDMAPAYGMKGLLLVGHLGKLVKLGAGIMNTHSRWGGIAAAGSGAGQAGPGDSDEKDRVPSEKTGVSGDLYRCAGFFQCTWIAGTDRGCAPAPCMGQRRNENAWERIRNGLKGMT